MIQRDFIVAWRQHAPWPTDAQVEQDLVLSRALVEIFRDLRRLAKVTMFRLIRTVRGRNTVWNIAGNLGTHTIIHAAGVRSCVRGEEGDIIRAAGARCWWDER